MSYVQRQMARPMAGRDEYEPSGSDLRGRTGVSEGRREIQREAHSFEWPCRQFEREGGLGRNDSDHPGQKQRAAVRDQHAAGGRLGLRR